MTSVTVCEPVYLCAIAWILVYVMTSFMCLAIDLDSILYIK